MLRLAECNCDKMHFNLNIPHYNTKLATVKVSLGLEDELYNSKPTHSLFNKVRGKEYRS
jgi:hypothetical protein